MGRSLHNPPFPPKRDFLVRTSRSRTMIGQAWIMTAIFPYFNLEPRPVIIRFFMLLIRSSHPHHPYRSSPFVIQLWDAGTSHPCRSCQNGTEFPVQSSGVVQQFLRVYLDHGLGWKKLQSHASQDYRSPLAIRSTVSARCNAR